MRRSVRGVAEPGGRDDPFALLGLPARAGLSDDDVRAAWRRIAAATHPDREDGGDPARFGAAAAAYVTLRTSDGRGEALADLGAAAAAGSARLPGRHRGGAVARRRACEPCWLAGGHGMADGRRLARDLKPPRRPETGQATRERPATRDGGARRSGCRRRRRARAGAGHPGHRRRGGERGGFRGRRLESRDGRGACRSAELAAHRRAAALIPLVLSRPCYADAATTAVCLPGDHFPTLLSW